ncbi:MAG: hypothetical protein ACKOFP_06850, partial [Actinomycetota bacterium]
GEGIESVVASILEAHQCQRIEYGAPVAPAWQPMTRGDQARADVYVLDEPTAGVDAESQEHIAQTFAQQRDAGRTVLLVTHELGTFSSLATRIIVLGRRHSETSTVLYDGPPPVPEHLTESVWHHSEDVVMRGDDGGLLERGSGS